MEQFTISFYGKHALILKAALISFLKPSDIMNALRDGLMEAGIDERKLREPAIGNDNLDIAADD